MNSDLLNQVIVLSDVDKIIQSLELDNEKYKLNISDKIYGIDLVDNNEKVFLIRQLEYKNTVIIETAIMVTEQVFCIVSTIYNKSFNNHLNKPSKVLLQSASFDVVIKNQHVDQIIKESFNSSHEDYQDSHVVYKSED